MKSALITGSTGFVGKNLLRSLVKDTDIGKFYLLVRNIEKANQILFETFKEAKKLNKIIILLEGDVTSKNIGLSSEDILKIEKVNEIYHLAANISLSKNDREKVIKVNLEGTINIFNTICKFRDITNIFYFSTGYICGKGKQVIKEEWIDHMNEFRNPYEESKYLAERFIKEFMDSHNISVTIIRPTIIGTKDNSKYKELMYQTIYYYATILKKAISLQDIGEEIRLVGKPDVTFNLIAIEDLINILLRIRKLSQKSRIYNLASKSNFSVLSYLEGIKEAIGFELNFNFIENKHFDNQTPSESLINRKTENYFEYDLDSYLDWDIDNTKDIREKLNIKDRGNEWIKDHIKNFLLSNKDEFIKKI